MSTEIPKLRFTSGNRVRFKDGPETEDRKPRIVGKANFGVVVATRFSPPWEKLNANSEADYAVYMCPEFADEPGSSERHVEEADFLVRFTASLTFLDELCFCVDEELVSA